ncbi:putative zinc-binding metallopeptidase [uncultured Algibacter sp.]|uniref:zinc-binding metallopeptidase n=1 Tax=uncultured Algibacter sp. TaxID=298659 RepID=UPI002611B6C5|nr:putative zinc-binding metallopeptidase [uncultured Algibacter sp.]
MKKYMRIILAIVSVLSFMSCSNSGDSVGESQIDTSTPILNRLDVWLRSNFVEPYNIEVLYKWDINDTDIDRFLHPPLQSSVRPVAIALQKAWVEPYTEVGGVDFIKNIAPRQFTFVGSFNFNPNTPTITLGIAEAGTKITLFNIDYLDFSDINSIKEPLKTVQHEYGHILNQNIPYDPIYNQINPQNYNANWFNRTDEEARELGYITAYASSQGSEDFVEMVSEMLTNSKTGFDAIVNSILNPESKAIIRQKEAMVADYYSTNFGIDIYELQELAYKGMVELVK